MTSLLTKIQTSTINGITGSTLDIGVNFTSNEVRIGTYTNVSLGGTSKTTAINGLSVNGETRIKNGLIMSGSNNITLGDGGVVPTSTQLGYIKSTASINTNTSGNNRVRFNFSFNVFSDKDSSQYYGLLLTPGTWLINYSLLFNPTISTDVIWIDYAYTDLVYNATFIYPNTGTTVVGATDSSSFYEAENYGFQLLNLSMSGITVEQITTNRYYNVRAQVNSLTYGPFSVSGKLTAVRIA